MKKKINFLLRRHFGEEEEEEEERRRQQQRRREMNPVEQSRVSTSFDHGYGGHNGYNGGHGGGFTQGAAGGASGGTTTTTISNDEEPQFLTLKCVVVGDGAVGKTSMLLCYTTNTFPTDHMPTIFDNYSKNVTMHDGRVVNLGLWDTAGQDEYADFRPLSYAAADCFVVAFSLIDRKSFRNVEHKWLQELRSKAPKTPIVLVGTKLDLRQEGGRGDIGGYGGSNKRGTGSFGRSSSGGYSGGDDESEPISEMEGQALARRIKAVSYVECSSLVQTNLSLVFDEVIEAHVNPAVVKVEEQKSCCAIQ